MKFNINIPNRKTRKHWDVDLIFFLSIKSEVYSIQCPILYLSVICQPEVSCFGLNTTRGVSKARAIASAFRQPELCLTQNNSRMADI